MVPLLLFIHHLIDLYLWVIIAAVVFSWLISFNVINVHNPMVRSIWNALLAVTEPLLKPIRNVLPDLGGLDISPIILYLGLVFVQFVVIRGWLIPLFS
jgi:YggT family protein